MAKILQFFIDVKNELAKVVWPSRTETVKYTGLVLLFTAVIALILGFADYGLIKLIEKVINH